MTQSPFGANPFEAPQAGGGRAFEGGGAGVLDPVRALTSGWEATKRNIGPWLGITVVGSLLLMVSIATVVGWIVVGPLLLWGAVVFTLNADEGEAQFGDLFSGFSRFGDALGGMLGYIVLTFIVGLPGSALSYANTAMQMTSGESNAVLGFLAPVVSLVWTFGVTIRLLYAPYYIVDQGLGPVEALKASWEVTRNQKANNAILVLLFIPVVVVGFLALCVGILPAMWVIYGGLAAGYRQLAGRTHAARSAF